MEYAEYYQDALSEPMKWFHLDADFMRDEKVRRLGVLGGWQAIGRYVALIACLAGHDGHIYDLSDECGWSFLAADMVCGSDVMGRDELEAFVSTLYSLRLIDRELWDESRKLTSCRLMREAENYAETRARGRRSAEIARAAKTAGKRP